MMNHDLHALMVREPFHLGDKFVQIGDVLSPAEADVVSSHTELRRRCTMISQPEKPVAPPRAEPESPKKPTVVKE